MAQEIEFNYTTEEVEELVKDSISEQLHGYEGVQWAEKLGKDYRELEVSVKLTQEGGATLTIT